MRPLKVTMKAFGPYLEKTVCDFTRLKDSRIFLISGPTGCGKTTILDAMTFALYGCSTGNLRGFKDMRNRMAPEEMDTEVSFEFVLRGKTYRFYRRFFLKKKRSGEFEPRTEAEGAVLEEGDWKLLCSGAEKNANKFAEELLQFTHNQFSQVIVLPQGEFRKLLLASSQEKLQILQVLFATGRWQMLTERLQARQKELEAAYKDLSSQIKALLSGVEAESEEQLAEFLTGAEHSLEAAKEQAEHYAKQLKQAEQAYEKAVMLDEKFRRFYAALKTREELDGLKEAVQEKRTELKRLTAHKDLYPYYTAQRAAEETLKKRRLSLEQCKIDLNKKKQALNQAILDFKKVDELEKREKTIQAEILRLQSLLPDAEKLHKQKKRCTVLEEDIKTRAQEISSLEDRLQPLYERIEKNETYITQQVEVYLNPLAEYLAEQTLLQKQLEGFSQLEEDRKRLAKLTEECIKKEQEAKCAAEKQAESEQALQMIEQKKRMDIAHVLAENLQSGKPCPVCGSMEHPMPAPPEQDVPDDQVLEKALERVQRDKNALLKSMQDLSLVKGEALIYEKRVGELEKELSNLPPVEKIREKHKELTVQIEQCNRYKAQHQNYSSKLLALKKEYEEGQKILQEKRISFKGLQTQHTAEREILADLRRRLGELPDAQKVMDALKSEEARQQTVIQQIETVTGQKEKAAVSHSSAQQAWESAASACKEAEAEADGSGRVFRNKAKEFGIEPALAIRQPDPETIAGLQKEISDFDARCKNTAELIQELNTALKDKKPPEILQFKSARDECKSRYFDKQKQVGEWSQRLFMLQSVCEKCESLKRENAALEKEYGRVARVAERLAGKNAHKTTIQSFVLGLMLDEVVLAASRFLQKLSRGRYSLVRVDVIGGRALRGLDIEVSDAHIGCNRPVSTLSGGEMFLASLSLAFGLAEVVQSYAGGVQLDSIFIDEGFGSLDTQTLECAMQALHDIQREGRLVGIISHVTELKERIAARIDLEFINSGTRLTITGV